MRNKKRERLEEYHTGKTTDLRNVVAEIQKVDQETMDLSSVVEEVQKVERKTDKKDTLVTCRLLFSSVYDKFFLFILLVGFIITTYFVFRGNVLGVFYGFWKRVLIEFGVLVLFAFLYYVFDWIYHCAIRTMMCVTKNQIYIERYLPLWRREISIPLSHVTSISAIHFLLIFRCVVIFRYHALPIVFFTWNSRKFKNKVMDLLGENGSITNYYDDTGILSSNYYVFMRWFLTIVFMVFVIIGLVHFFGYILSDEIGIAGTYRNGKENIVLKRNGTCSINLSNRDLKNVSCSWKMDGEEILMTIDQDTIEVPYKENDLLYGGVKYTKK